jgi:hypothetical protein
MELPWWQWGAVLLGRLHLQEQEPYSQMQEGNNISNMDLNISINYFKSSFPNLCTIPTVWHKIFRFTICTSEQLEVPISFTLHSM